MDFSRRTLLSGATAAAGLLAAAPSLAAASARHDRVIINGLGGIDDPNIGWKGRGLWANNAVLPQ